MPNFSFLSCLEVIQKFVVVVVTWGGLALMSLVSNLNPSCIELKLGLSFANKLMCFDTINISLGTVSVNLIIRHN